MTTFLVITSWIVFASAMAVTIQNFFYLHKGHKRRQGFHFAIGLLALYLASLYFIAAVDPTNYLVRMGLPTKVGIVIQLYLIYKMTVMDEADYRLDDRLGRRHDN